MRFGLSFTGIRRYVAPRRTFRFFLFAMKSFLLVVAVMLGLAVSAHAQPRLSAYATGGVSVPTFPAAFGDFYRSGVHLGGGVGLRLWRRSEATIAVQYSRYTLDEDALRNEFDLRDSFTFDGGVFRSLGLTADLRYDIYPSGQARPYALFGVGLYDSRVENLTVDDGTASAEREGNEEIVAGLMAGVGVRVPVGSGFIVFAAPRYTLLLAQNRLLFAQGRSRHFLDLQIGVGFRP